MLNYIIGFVIVCVTTYLGWGIDNYYKKRILFYKELNDLTNYLIQNINFYKDSVNTILSNFILEHKPNKSLENIISSYVEGQVYINESIIKNEEYSVIKNLFLHLGKSDSENQIAELDNASFSIKKIIEKCENDYNKVGKISTKLGTLFGLTLVICLL